REVLRMVLPAKAAMSQECRNVAKFPTPVCCFLNKTLTAQRIFCSVSQGNPQGGSARKNGKREKAANTYYYQDSEERIVFSSVWFFNNKLPSGQHPSAS